MMKSSTPLLSAIVSLLLAGCATEPTGPSTMALPGTGKSFEQFRADDADCRQYAHGGASQAAVDPGLRSAAVGTVVGALAGAAIGGRQGAGVGAGTGLLVGSVAGSGAAQSAAYGSQRQYDNTYVQCMYAKGHKVPVPASVARSQSQMQTPAAAPPIPPTPSSGYYPPPPPGYASPPPSGDR